MSKSNKNLSVSIYDIIRHWSWPMHFFPCFFSQLISTI